MERLSENWVTDGLIDFEYKKYILLAYLQNAKERFGERKLYPLFNDLIFHFQNLQSIKKNKALYYENFPERISKADFKKLEITYQKIVEDDDLMKEIEDIIYFAIPKVQQMVEEGKEIYELIEGHLDISPVGLSPLYPDEGYMFLQEFNQGETQVYRYKITIFESVNEKFRGIHTVFLESVRRGFGETYESMKLNILQKRQELPNPATFVIVSKIPCPLNESLLPVSKRVLVKHISTLAA